MAEKYVRPSGAFDYMSGDGRRQLQASGDVTFGGGLGTLTPGISYSSNSQQVQQPDGVVVDESGRRIGISIGGELFLDDAGENSLRASIGREVASGDYEARLMQELLDSGAYEDAVNTFGLGADLGRFSADVTKRGDDISGRAQYRVGDNARFSVEGSNRGKPRFAFDFAKTFNQGGPVAADENPNSILNLDPDAFVAALDELGIYGEERNFLTDQYFAQNRALPMTQRPEGKTVRNILPIATPEGMTGAEALMSGDFEFTAPEFLRGLYEGPAEAINVASAIGKGVPVTEEQVQQAGQIVPEMVTGIGPATFAARSLARGVEMPDPTVVSMSGVGPRGESLTLYHGSPHNYAAERLVKMPDGSTQYIVGAPDELPDVPEGAEVLQDFPLGRARLDKMGTGAGAQAYGPGLYTGDIVDTASSYRNKLSKNSKLTAFGGKEYFSARDLAKDMLGDRDPDTTEADELLDPLSSAVFRLMKTSSLDSAVENMRADFEDIRSPELLSEAEALFRAASPQIKSSGRIYEIEVPVGTEDFIDYDFPVSQQPKKVQDFLQDLVDRGLAKSTNQALMDAFSPGREGRIIAEEAAKAGLGGNKFPASTQGSYNYVLVNENLINIVRKYGIAGAAAMLGVTAADVEQALAENGEEGPEPFSKGGPVQGSSLDVDVFALR
jgi:hypothetical protein